MSESRVVLRFLEKCVRSAGRYRSSNVLRGIPGESVLVVVVVAGVEVEPNPASYESMSEAVRIREIDPKADFSRLRPG